MCVQILNKERELDALKTRNEYLEAQIRDAVEKYKKKEEDLQVTDMICHCIYTYDMFYSSSGPKLLKIKLLFSIATGAYRGD